MQFSYTTKKQVVKNFVTDHRKGCILLFIIKDNYYFSFLLSENIYWCHLLDSLFMSYIGTLKSHKAYQYIDLKRLLFFSMQLVREAAKKVLVLVARPRKP